MRPEELMLGDIIKTPKGIRKIEELSNKNYLLNWEDYGCTVEEVEPVPLTAEILEKNGFKKNDAGYKWFKADDKSYYFGFDSIYYDHEDNFLNITKEFSQDMSQSQVKGKYKYIHELQHAIKLCKIEKEIEL